MEKYTMLMDQKNQYSENEYTIQSNLSIQCNSYQAAASAAAAKSLQSCPTLCNPINGGPPGSHIPGILQARTLEWVAISHLLKRQFYKYWINMALLLKNHLSMT